MGLGGSKRGCERLYVEVRSFGGVLAVLCTHERSQLIHSGIDQWCFPCLLVGLKWMLVGSRRVPLDVTQVPTIDHYQAGFR